jgi:hypothetical protein
VTTLLVVALMGLIAGAFLMLNISPIEFADNIMGIFKNRRKTLAQRIKEATAEKKVKGIRKIIIEAKEILSVSGKQHLLD